ncbi:MAG: hypothetical protein U0903_07120 [Planctomycetales bacterium]
MLNPWALHPLATWTISSSEGVMRPLRPIMATFLRSAGEDLLAGDHDAEVDDPEVIAGEDDADDVLADIVTSP